jgi:type I restriction enzyme S subunit
MSWKTSTLGDICSPKQWPTLSKSDLMPAGFPVFGANGQIGFSDKMTHRHPTILVGCRGSCGTLHITPPNSYANGNAMALDALDTRLVDISFLKHFLKYRGFDDVITGTSQPQIIRQNIVKIKVPLPPMGEQQRIAAVLNLADVLCDKRGRSLAGLSKLIDSVFDEIVASPDSKKWPSLRLTEIFNFKTGKLDSNAASENGPYPFFTCAREDFRTDTFAFDCEALLLAGNNASADYSVKHFKGKFNAYQRTYVLTLRNLENVYAYAQKALERKLFDLKFASKGTNTKYLTMGIFDTMKICVPPPSIQRHFAKRKEGIDKVMSRCSASLASMNELQSSIQSRAFREML